MSKNILIVGATGLVGRTVLKEIEHQNLQDNNFVLMASKKSNGKTLKIANKKYKVKTLTRQNLDRYNFDYALFATGEDVSKMYVEYLAKKGTVVIDFSSYFRKKYPLVVPEINRDKIKGNIICNPNCSTIAGVLSVYNIYKHFGLTRIVYSTYQAISGAGQKALKDLKTTNFKKLKTLPNVLNDNLFSYIGKINTNGYCKEENKMIYESKKILDDFNIKITATCIRVPISICHSESINFTTTKNSTLAQIKNCLKNFKGINFVDNNVLKLMPIMVRNGDDVFVGRVRKDELNNKTYNMFVVSDNLKKGSAQNAVQILKCMLEDNNV